MTKTVKSSAEAIKALVESVNGICDVMENMQAKHNDLADAMIEMQIELMDRIKALEER